MFEIDNNFGLHRIRYEAVLMRIVMHFFERRSIDRNARRESNFRMKVDARYGDASFRILLHAANSAIFISNPAIWVRSVH